MKKWLFFLIPIYATIILDQEPKQPEKSVFGCITATNFESSFAPCSRTMSLAPDSKICAASLPTPQFFKLFRFISQECSNGKQDEGLYISLNIDEGTKLQLSDGSTYEIAPEDRIYAAYWITPFPIQLSPSENSEYPVKITNMYTNTSVNGKKISTREMLQEEAEKYKKMPQPTPRKIPKPKPKIQ